MDSMSRILVIDIGARECLELRISNWSHGIWIFHAVLEYFRKYSSLL